MKRLLLVLLFVGGCGQPRADDDVTFTTPLGVEVHTKAGYPQWSEASIDAAFTAVVGEPLELRSNATWHPIIDTLTFDLGVLAAYGWPDVYFVKDAVTGCPIDGTVEDSGLGCYHPPSVDGGKARIVVRIVSSGGGCIAEETYLNHFVAHFVQQVYGYPLDHNAPIWPDYGQSLEIIIQRWFFHAACGE